MQMHVRATQHQLYCSTPAVQYDANNARAISAAAQAISKAAVQAAAAGATAKGSPHSPVHYVLVLSAPDSQV